MAYLLPLYPVLKASENLSIRLGNERFPTGADGWKCQDCYSQHDIEAGNSDGADVVGTEQLCRKCKVAWVREVGHIDYSDAFERQLGIYNGTAFLEIGICAMLLNENNGGALWKEGDALYWVCYFVS